MRNSRIEKNRSAFWFSQKRKLYQGTELIHRLIWIIQHILFYNGRFDSVADDRTIGNFFPSLHMEPRGFIIVAKAFKDLDKNSPLDKFGLLNLFRQN